MDMQLRRQSDNSLISDQIYFFEGWQPDHPPQSMKTKNNVTYLQDRGRLEWYAPVTFMFTDEFSTSSVSNMYALIRLARLRQWFVFTDKYGDVHNVRVKNAPLVPERDDESPLVAIFYVEAHLLMQGYE